jgi:SAM-dependent methyltransferase
MSQHPVSFETIPADSAWGSLLRNVATRWPEHTAFLTKSANTASRETRATAERTASLIARLVGENWDKSVEGYRWMCEMVLAEELAFRRSGNYRFSRFSDVQEAVYGDTEVMGNYMSGLLLSQALWPNHLAICDFYARRFLVHLQPSSRHLEIGPGHGLLLFLAAEYQPADVAGWDISETSLSRTESCLRALGIKRSVVLEQRDIFAALRASDECRFDSVVLSEVLEHLERPRDALAAVRRVLAPNGRLFVNAPVNSPAIDHIYLFRTPEELIELVRSVGFEIEETRLETASDHAEERARRLSLPISVAIVARA